MRQTRLSANPLDGTLRQQPQVLPVSCMAQDFTPDHSTLGLITAQLETRGRVWRLSEDFHSLSTQYPVRSARHPRRFFTEYRVLRTGY